jgi:hypothetical protein
MATAELGSIHFASYVCAGQTAAMRISGGMTLLEITQSKSFSALHSEIGFAC